MKTVTFSSGRAVPALGLGTWKMGEDRRLRAREVTALQRGIDLGMTLVDTAEMYAEGGAEEVVGQAIRGRRDGVFVVSKVYPHNATRRGVIDACERSLTRLGVESIDLYLLHWRGSVPLAETFQAFVELKRSGKIGSFGVSNFDTSDMEEAWSAEGGPEMSTNQILYNLTRRGVELDLLPWCGSHGVPVMAYSPVEQGQLLRNRKLQETGGIIAIPKASDIEHVEENRKAAEISLTAGELSDLDREFPRPVKRVPLEML